MKFSQSGYNLILQLVSIIVITAAIFSTYIAALNHSFVWDDIYYLLGNPYISHLDSGNIQWMLTSTHLSNWHPVTWFSYALDFYIYGGLDTYGYHLTNVILHTLNSILFLYISFILLKIIFSQPYGQLSLPQNRKLFVSAFFGAIFFAVHPQHVESVAWVAERKDLLFLFFLQLAFLSYIKFIFTNKRKAIPYLLSVGLFALSLMSKPMAVTFPAILLLIDAYPLRRFGYSLVKSPHIPVQSGLKILIEKIPYIVLSMISIFMTLSAQSQAIEKMEHLGIVSRLHNAFNSIIFYLQKTFVPLNLSPYYPHPHLDETTDINILITLAGFILISLVALYLLKLGRPALITAWSFYLVTLSPVIGIIQVGTQAAADRYTYLTTMPVYLFLSAGIFFILKKSAMVLKVLTLAILFFLSITLINLSWSQVDIWSTRVDLWKHAARLYPDNGHINGNLASAYYSIGDYNSAARYYEEAIRNGYFSVSHLTTAALAYIRLENHHNALQLYYAAIDKHHDTPEIKPLLDCIYYNIVVINLKRGNTNEAKVAFNKIEATSEYYEKAHLTLADQTTSSDHALSTSEFCEQIRELPY
jgi:hypothetical protein